MQLESALERIAEVTGVPVILYDAQWRLAGHSDHSESSDAPRLSNIVRGRISEVAAHRILTAGQEGQAVLRLPADSVRKTPPRVIHRLESYSHLLGYLVYDDVDPDDRVRAKIETVLGEVLPEFHYHLQARLELAEAEQRANLVDILLSPLGGDHDWAAKTLLGRGYVPQRECYAVLHFGVHSTTSTSIVQQNLVDELPLGPVTGGKQPSVVWHRTTDGAVIVVTGSPPSRLLHALDQRLRDTPFRFGVGSPREQLSDLFLSYREARLAQRAASMPPSPASYVSWQAMGVNRALIQLPIGDIVPTDLPDSVQKLLSLAASNTELYTTARAIVANSGDLQQTAREIVIHRSTLYYRLDRLLQWTGIDLRDADTRFEIALGLRIADLMDLTSPVTHSPGHDRDPGR